MIIVTNGVIIISILVFPEISLPISAHQKIGLIEKISPIKLYTKVKKSIEKNTNIRYNLIDEN